MAIVCVFTIGAMPALADGGTVILHKDAGPFSVTLFAPGIPLEVGQTDLSVLVQDRQSGKVLFDPEVDISTVELGSNAPPVTTRLTRAMATNRLLQAANIQFSHPGRWRLELDVRRGEETVTLSTELTVNPDGPRAKMVKFYLLLPIGIILLFAAHQALKSKQTAMS